MVAMVAAEEDNQKGKTAELSMEEKYSCSVI